jgi:chemotaxis protein MotB
MAAPDPSLQPIIIKKKVVHGGHHGGAWKVAYADFVTAMMALFIVLWLMNSNEQVQKAVGGYFRDPSGKSELMGTGTAGLGPGVDIGKDDLGHLKEKIEAALKEAPALENLKEQVEMTVTGEGLRIELAEAEKSTFFESGNATPTAAGEQMLGLVAKELSKLPNRVLVEGHTDSRPFGPGASYTNWELSTDRANAARRLMERHGLKMAQTVAVRGFADQSLRKPADPANPANRRISIVVQWLDAKPGKLAEKHAEKPHDKPAEKHAEKPHDKPAEKHAEKPHGKHSEKPATVAKASH